MKPKRTCLLAILVAFLSFQSGCTSGTLLLSHSIPSLDARRGTYDLILYSGQNFQDPRSVAILDRTDDPYTIVPYGAPFHYRTIEGLSAADALKNGERFVHRLYAFRATEKREILGPDHTVIGYELRPLFMPLDTGYMGDIVDTSYLLRSGDRVMAYVGLKGSCQNQRESDGGSDHRHGDRD